MTEQEFTTEPNLPEQQGRVEGNNLSELLPQLDDIVTTIETIGDDFSADSEESLIRSARLRAADDIATKLLRYVGGEETALGSNEFTVAVESLQREHDELQPYINSMPSSAYLISCSEAVSTSRDAVNDVIVEESYNDTGGNEGSLLQAEDISKHERSAELSLQDSVEPCAKHAEEEQEADGHYNAFKRFVESLDADAHPSTEVVFAMQNRMLRLTNIYQSSDAARIKLALIAEDILLAADRLRNAVERNSVNRT